VILLLVIAIGPTLYVVVLSFSKRLLVFVDKGKR
jgi:hypothetical protein